MGETWDVLIRRYASADAAPLRAMLEREGAEWQDYWRGENWAKYERALADAVVYVLFEGAALCGFARCRDDSGYGLYVYDLLVDKAYRGRGHGERLLRRAAGDFPNTPTYVMSDVDGYYEKLGYQKEGTIFIVDAPTE